MQKYFQAIAHRLKVGFSTIPSFSDWLYAAILLLIYAGISLPVGFLSDWLQFQVVSGGWTKITGVVIRAFFVPGISEELIFRVLLLPHPTENISLKTKWLWGGIGLFLFIIYHPLQTVTTFPAAFATFNHPVFLLLTAFLGIACTLAYWRSSSIWTAIFIHWIIVVVWLVLLGGYDKLFSYQ
jgi:predicted Abi (CAAX) family protease